MTFAGVLLASLLLTTCVVAVEDADNDVEKVPTKCPGLYCGRTMFANQSYSECGACPRGSRPDTLSLCQRCGTKPPFYDWLYLGFMAAISLLLHWFFIDFTNKRKRALVVLHLSSVTESVLAGIITLLLSEPRGTLGIRSCDVKQLADWYTMLYNPTPDYKTTLHCTQEIVFPLYTIVMVYYAFSLVFLLAVRPIISWKFMEGRGTKSIYAALYFLPVLLVVHAIFGGLVYYTFPYILLVTSAVTEAIHLAYYKDQTVRDIFRDSFTNPRNLMILLAHWVMQTYGIVAITKMDNLGLTLPLILLVPFPTFFYIATVKFTDPDHLNEV